MATATFAISNVTEGESWYISMSGVDFNTAINLKSYYSSNTIVTLNNVPKRSSTSPLYIRSIYSSGNDEPYFTWREYNWDLIDFLKEFGHSLDLWSSDLYRDIVTNNFTWSQINNKTYNLSNNKYSLLYFYTYSQFDKSLASTLYWSRGGILTVNVVE